MGDQYSKTKQYQNFYHDNEEDIHYEIYMGFEGYYGRENLECIFEGTMIERFNDFIGEFGIYFNSDDYERYRWFVQDFKLNDNKISREKFITFETQQGHDYGYEADNKTPLW